MTQESPDTIARQVRSLRDYEWQPDQREINQLALALGRDVTREEYYEELHRVLKRLYGLRVCYIALLTVRWPPGMLAKVGMAMAGPYEVSLMQRGLAKLDRNVRLALTKAAIDDEAEITGVFENPLSLEASFATPGS